ncbi:iron-sulfur cluster biosynthesis family protein [Bacillus lacus]|uniref:Iron-sulfur cluster biosynthesis family protein n=1 Tax=Metabacillus lacus TaxID=1983721 RepID=A0A7X2J2T4_9BACI|nr:iron-sulfur cluster biosynthesis family protein [Metabacillus lacus]MRX74274.1 iron-sulfur cluster biosynthesis family protein [Metabacillus lacus]
MNITFAEKAMEKIDEVQKTHPGYVLKLKYDTEGCGCVVSGVPALWLVKEHEEADISIVETNFGSVGVEKSKIVFMDEQLTVDFSESSNTFMLKCPSQILNPRMTLVVK